MLTLKMKFPGNPDYGQREDIAAPFVARDICPTRLVDLAMEKRDSTGAGGGNWNAVLLKGEKVVARISYNGRVWPDAEWTPGMKDLTPAEIAAL